MFKKWKSTKRLDIFLISNNLEKDFLTSSSVPNSFISARLLIAVLPINVSEVMLNHYLAVLPFPIPCNTMIPVLIIRKILPLCFVSFLLNASTLTTLMSLKIGHLVCTLNLANFLILSVLLRRFIN